MNDPYQTRQSLIQKQLPQNNPNKLQLDTNGQISLIASKGWLRFLSVIGFISFALIILWLIGVMVSLQYSVGLGVMLMIILSILAIVVFKLAHRLSKYSSAIKRVMEFHDPADFESAMEEQMRFWRLFGILTIIWVLLAVLGMFS